MAQAARTQSDQKARAQERGTEARAQERAAWDTEREEWDVERKQLHVKLDQTIMARNVLQNELIAAQREGKEWEELCKEVSPGLGLGLESGLACSVVVLHDQGWVL